MKNKILSLLVAGAMVTCFAVRAQALPMIAAGSGISLSGTYVTDTGNINTAHAFVPIGTTSFLNVYVQGVTGSFLTAGVATGLSATINMIGFSFNPFPSGGVLPLWATSAGPVYVDFDFLHLTSMEQTGNNVLTLIGSGTLHMAGYAPTPGLFVFSANQLGGTFSWSSSNVAIPDGGTTALLLGLGMVGIGFVARRLKIG